MFQGIIGKEFQSVGNVGVITGARHFFALVVSDAGQMTQHLAQCDGPCFARKRWDIALHRGIQIQLSPFIELQSGYSSDGFGDGT